jgi:RND superfamily putative drug exporter
MRKIDGVSALIARHRWAVLVGWVVVLAALAPAAARVEHVLDVSARVPDSESATVEMMLRDRFGSPFARYAVLVITGAPDPARKEGRDLLEKIIAGVSAERGVTGTASFLDSEDPVFRGANGGEFVLVGVDATTPSADALVAPLRATSERMAAGIRKTYPGFQLRWTGDIALNHDIRLTSASQGQQAERRALPLTLAMLLVAFGSLIAAALPVAAGIAGIVAALGVAGTLAQHWSLSILLSNVVSMIGLGLGIDYALLTVSRFREELGEGHAPHDAAARAARSAGRTILVSGAAVLVGFLGLSLIPLNELRGVAVGGALVVSFSIAVAVTLLPALLAILGTRVGRGWKFRRRGKSAKAVSRWRHWGNWVVAHPLLVLLLAGAPLIVLAAQARKMETSLPRSGWLPASMESARALDDLTKMDRAGVVQSLRVIVLLPRGMSALEGDGWRAVARLGHELAADPTIERVQSLPMLTRRDEPSLGLVSMIPADARRSFVSTDQRAALLEVLPRSSVDFPALSHLVRKIRGRQAGELTGVAGASVLIGGLPAFNVDYEDAIAGRMPIVIALVLGGTLLALLIGFRSVLIPLKALILNLLSVAGALGAVVLVFQDGHGVSLLGVHGAMGGLFPALPVLVFCIVFGLSMDYEVFLVARVAEARRNGADESEAIVEGLVRTGGVITSAAAVMIIVFAAFTLGEFLMVKVLGFALAVAVLLDATIVRLAIGPALLKLAGRWNWWPGRRVAP